MGENTAEFILVVEDEIEIRELLIMLLKRQGFKVVAFSSALEALKKYQDLVQENDKIDLIVLDWMLPGMTGIEFLKSFAEKEFTPRPPVLMVTAKAESKDIVQGLEAGADDYITKPFEPSIFIARIRALIRRARAIRLSSAEMPSEFRVGELSLNIQTHEVKGTGQILHLTPSEFKILAEMFKGQGKVLTREFLVGVVQGDGISVTTRTIDTHVFGLRKKMGVHAEWVETIRGVGYRLRYE